MIKWDECPRCGEEKYSTAALCHDCSTEYRAAKMRAKLLAKRLVRGDKFTVVLMEE